MTAQHRKGRVVTCESMAFGHPDKLCDRISDAILDAHLFHDPYTRCGIEAAASGNEVWVFGQVASRDPLNHAEIYAVARRVICESGYESAAEGIDPYESTIRVTIDPQSGDIAQGVARANGVIGASDQGIVYGYATDETPEGLPLPLVLARRLTTALNEARSTGAIPWLRPDGKAQVSVRYAGGTSQGVSALVLSAQHRAEVEQGDVEAVLTGLALRTIGEHATPGMAVHVNPTGRFVTGGPLADSGLTGRKVIADTYGGVAHHGGGAFSGKDGTKVDRSAAYAARQAALYLVREGLAARVEIALAYAIGVEEPVAIDVESFGTARKNNERLAKIVAERFDFRPAAMIERLDLRSPNFERTARDGHFGVAGLPWETTAHTSVEKPKIKTITSCQGSRRKVAHRG